MVYGERSMEKPKVEWEKKAQETEKAVKGLLKEITNNYRDNPEDLAELFSFGSRFYNYSPKNVALIYGQNRGASYVQSFHAWKQMKYSVLSKEKAIKIWIPVQTTLLDIGENIFIPKSKATKIQIEDYEKGKIKGIVKTGFKIGSVFDISQTNFPKEEYPKLFSMGYPSQLHNGICKGLEDFAGDYLKCMVKTSDLSSITIRGLYTPILNTITLNDKLEDSHRLSTLSHELGHAIIHHTHIGKSTAQKEIEADGLSIMLESNYGLEINKQRKSHFKNHYDEFINQLRIKNTELTEQEIDKRVDEVLTTVLTSYSNHIDNINKCVEKYVPNEMIVEYGANKADTNQSKTKHTSYMEKALKKRTSEIKKTGISKGNCQEVEM